MSEPTSERDWCFCDGAGGMEHQAARPTRREVLRNGATAAVTGLAALGLAQGSALAQVALNPGATDEAGGTGRDVLVSIFLRGAADGLSMAVPYADDDYYRARPALALAAPAKGTAVGDGKDGKSVRLDDRFALHPALAPLAPLFHDGTMAAVHAVGSGDQTRSHFEAMAAMERGLYTDAGREASGWLARHLLTTTPGTGAASPLRAVVFSNVLFDSLRGATDVSVLTSLSDFRLDLPRPELARNLAALYGGGSDAVATAGRETLAVLKTLERLDPASYRPANGAEYPGSSLGQGLKQTASLVKARVGMEVACLDRGGWDTHVGQGGATGWLAAQLDDVAKSVAAFVLDLGDAEMRRVTVLVQTEFGRRVRENSGLGTDHGRASALFVLGGGVNGGRVYGQWPGLKPDQLENPGDLRVTTDYRDVLAEIVAKRLRNEAGLPTIFPNTRPRYLGIVRA